MITKVKNLVLITMAVMVGLMAGCGAEVGDSTILDGTASKGIIYPGAVTIFAVEEGVKSSIPLMTVPTDQNGKFSADLGQYKGPVVIEATGTYTDEASGLPVTIDAANPLRAAINDVGGVTGGKKCAVTPLTDLAFGLMADAPLTNENIGAANARVADVFKLSDIVWTEPVRADTAVLAASDVTAEQRVYTIALATLSQMAKNANDGTPAAFTQIKDILGSFKSDLSASPTAGLVPANTSAFTDALGTVTASTLNGFSEASAKLQNVSRTEIKLTLSAAAAPAGTLIGGIQGTIILPPGTNVRTDGSTEAVHSGVLVTDGIATTSLSGARYTADTRTVSFALLYGDGFTGGDFATLLVNIQKGATFTAADFGVSGSKVLDTAGNVMNIAITSK
jgi:hypothetical protein